MGGGRGGRRGGRRGRGGACFRRGAWRSGGRREGSEDGV